MGNQIEVFVKKKKSVSRQYVTPPVSDGYVHHGCMSKQVTEYDEVLPEADKIVLEIANQFASERDMQVKVYDVSTFTGKFKALSKGIKKTPTLIIGKEKIDDITPESIRGKLKSF